MLQVLTIKCPHEGCENVYQDEDIKMILEDNYFKKYLRFKNTAMLNQNPNIRWCIRPGCEKFIIGEPDKPYLRCECGMEMCFNCSNEYHNGKTCAEMIDIVYKEYAKKVDIQFCPNCKSYVEKDNAGCNHMRCW